MKRIISLCLLLTVFCSALLLPSCDNVLDEENSKPHSSSHPLYPEGYTGGFGFDPGETTEFWWVETYEECLEAIELLKSNGSTFKKDTVLTYDGDLFDCKYCFVITGVTGIGDSTEKIEWGDNPFDRYAKDVYLWCYAFFDDVTIDELNYSTVGRYKGYRIDASSILSYLKDEITVDNIEITEWTKSIDWDKDTNQYYKDIFYNDYRLIRIKTSFFVSK